MILVVCNNKATAEKNQYGMSNTNEKKIVYCQKKFLILLGFKNFRAEEIPCKAPLILSTDHWTNSENWENHVSALSCSQNVTETTCYTQEGTWAALFI